MRRQVVSSSVAVVALGIGFAVAPTVAGATELGQHPVLASAKATRHMTTRVHQSPLQIRVRVRNYPKSTTHLQKKACGTCAWHNVARRPTDADGRVLYPLDAPATGSWFYRVSTPERPQWAESFSGVIKTFRAKKLTSGANSVASRG